MGKSKSITILIVGAWSWPQYEHSFARGLQESGIEIKKLSTSVFFIGVIGKIQNKFPLPVVALFRLNRAIKLSVRKHKPNFVLFWRPTNIFPNTINYIEKIGVKTISYNNDDPFGSRIANHAPWHHYFLWFWYFKSLNYFSYNFFYRQINCHEAKELGVSHAEVLLPYFIPWRDKPTILNSSELKTYQTDVVFIGHFESDGRKDSIRAILDADIKIKIWGDESWSRKTLGDLFERLSPILPAEGENYSKALCGAKICLCFLSKLNRDSYTRRCFEIPACGRLLLTERSKELMQLFKEDKEACFFSTNEELVKKIRWLLNNPDIIERIAQAGQKRCLKDNHDVVSRAKQFLSMIDINN